MQLRFLKGVHYKELKRQGSLPGAWRTLRQIGHCSIVSGELERGPFHVWACQSVVSDPECASDARMLGFLATGGARKFAFLTNMRLVLRLLGWDHILRTVVL